MIEFKDVARAILETIEKGEPAALASVVGVRGSSPRHNGARMLIWPDGRIVGTIGGGTLEYRVVEDARQAIAEGTPRYLNYVFDASGRPGSVGLCGGSVDIHIDVNLDDFEEVARRSLESLERGEAVALATLVCEGPLASRRPERRMLIWADGRTHGSLGSPHVDAQVAAQAAALFEEGAPHIVSIAEEEGSGREPRSVEVHLDILEPDLSLLIIGAGHVAQPLALMGSLMGFRVLVVDDRPDWANSERFPTAAEIAIVDYEPEEEILAPIPFPMSPATHVVITTWGYDLPAMEQALRQNPAYIGLVASPTKARVLFKRLRAAGFPDEEIRRIRAPIGLDVGAESPAEIAVSILGEILAVMRGKSGRPLREVRGERIDSLFATPALVGQDAAGAKS